MRGESGLPGPAGTWQQLHLAQRWLPWAPQTHILPCAHLCAVQAPRLPTQAVCNRVGGAPSHQESSALDVGKSAQGT